MVKDILVSDDIHQRLKVKAAEKGNTIRGLTEEILDAALPRPQKK